MFGFFLLFMGTAQSQNGELILATPDLSSFTCEEGEVHTFIWKYNFTEDGFDKQCDDIDPASVSLSFTGADLVGGPSVSGCFVSINIRCTGDEELDIDICVNALDGFQANGLDADSADDDGVGCFDLMDFTVPVEMVFFNANMDDNRIVLNWQTASEVDNEGFEVQKSSDGKSFEELHFVNSTRSSGIKNYRYVDNYPVAGINYYRLKQMDFNGNFEYSEIISVRNNNKVSPISLYPNPISVNELVNVFVDSEMSSEARVRVYSISGAVITTNRHFLNEGLNKLRIQTSDLAEGIYIISVEMGAEVFNKRLVIQ